ncbi:MAG: hypothetical protein HY774_12165 [Acidobacteria bacterium]|nr:hypothetical protein [Acidobacteriota bacterium]
MNWFKSLWFVFVVVLFVQPMIMAQSLVNYCSSGLKNLPVSGQVEAQERVPEGDPLKTQEIPNIKQESNLRWVYYETDNFEFKIDVEVFGTPKLARKSYQKYLRLNREYGLTDIQLPDLGNEANGWPDLQFPILYFREKNLVVIVKPYHSRGGFSHGKSVNQICPEPIDMKVPYGAWLQIGQQFAKHFWNYLKRQNEEGNIPFIQRQVITDYSVNRKEIRTILPGRMSFLIRITELPTVSSAANSIEHHTDYDGPTKPAEIIKNTFVDEAKIQPSIGGICTRTENIRCCIYSAIMDKNDDPIFNLDYSKDLIPYVLEFIKEKSK